MFSKNLLVFKIAYELRFFIVLRNLLYKVEFKWKQHVVVAVISVFEIVLCTYIKEREKLRKSM